MPGLFFKIALGTRVGSQHLHISGITWSLSSLAYLLIIFATHGRLFTFNASSNNLSSLTGRTSDHGVGTPALISKVDIAHQHMSVSKYVDATIHWQILFSVYIKVHPTRVLMLSCFLK